MAQATKEKVSESRDHPETIIELSEIRKEYGDIVAVDDVSMDIKRGELFTILGPSGSGKSTTLQLISGVENPTSGEIKLNGEVINDVKPYQRNMSMVFQEFALFEHMNARENVEYGLKIRGVDKASRDERIEELFNLFQLSGKEEREVNELSGGERQRVATARSLAIEPEILLLDEVFSSLDEKLSKEMQTELRKIQQKVGKTFIFVTHSQEKAFGLSDRIAVMRNGKVEQIGEPSDLYRNPANEFVSEFIGVTNIISGTVTEINNNVAMVESEGLTYHVQNNAVDIAVDSAVKMSIPKEQIHLLTSRDAAQTDNVYEGTIVDTIFKGPYIEFEIELSNGEYLRVTTTSDAHQTTDDDVFLEIGPQAFNIF